jgi:tRNA (guanine-N7-)-methyltransferase
MTVNKLERFEDIAEFNHVLEHTDYQENDRPKPQGRWNTDIFGNSNPITLELACGKGDYTLELARRNPDRNYVGIDIKGARIWKGAKQALAEDLENVRFMRMFIDHLDEYFGAEEVDEIWITFADPYSTAGDRSKRLTAPKFLQMYKKIVRPGGLIHFKTDDTPFFKYTCRRVSEAGGSIIKKVDDIYSQEPDNETLTIKTAFEKKHLQKEKTISYCAFSLS